MEYISIKQACSKLGLSDRQVRNLCAEGKITGAVKVGSSWIIPENCQLVQKGSLKEFQEKFKKRREIYNLKFNYVIVHGTFGHPGENWFPWLAEEIAKLDVSGNTKKEDILIPHFPSSASSDYDSWKSILLGYIDSGIINKNTIFICHSLGPLFVSRVLIEKQIKVKGMISVEAAANHLTGNPSFDKINSTFFVPSWDYLDQVKKYVDFNYCFYSDNDPVIPINILKEYVDHAATKSFFIPNSGHFNEASGYKTFPQLLELIKTIELDESVDEQKVKELSHRDGWTSKLSHTWTNMTWPNRPSVGELAIYTNVLRKAQEASATKKKVLICGSNVEFRDWAYEEDLDVSIMHNNEEYHMATYRELRHKNAPYTLILRDWQGVEFDSAFDFIVGDQLIGNLGRVPLETFLKNVSRSLRPGGHFLSKSYYRPADYKVKTKEEIFMDYNKNARHLNPIAYCGFDLTMLCLNKHKLVDFEKMANIIDEAHNSGLIDDVTHEKLSSMGLGEMNYSFYVPSREEYERLVEKYFVIEKVCFTSDVKAENFPIYILRKK